MKILQVLTSHDQLGNTGRKTGFWLEEGAAPYFVFRDAGVDLTLASPKGGQPPIDPKSDLPENQTLAMARFKKDEKALEDFANTKKLVDMRAENFDTVFYSGGHGPMWDLAESPVSIALLESFYNSGKVIALVCHAPGVLRHVTYKGEPLVKGKHVTGFTNGEEEEVKLTHVVPFLVEDELLRLGATFEQVTQVVRQSQGPQSEVRPAIPSPARAFERVPTSSSSSELPGIAASNGKRGAEPISKPRVAPCVNSASAAWHSACPTEPILNRPATH